MQNRVVITGAGVVSPIGTTTKDFSTNMFAGKSGVVNIRGGFTEENFPVPYAAIIDRTRLQKSINYEDLSSLPKSWIFTALATEEALNDLDGSAPIDGFVYGTADGLSFEIVLDSLREFGADQFNWNTVRSESPLLIIEDILKKRGHPPIAPHKQISLNSACATGTQTIGVAFQRIRSGEWTRALAGGVDARCEPSNLLNFNMLGALTTAEVEPETASRPFSKTRSGFVRGEAAATVLLESLESAQARNATILAEVTGYSFTSDAYRLTDGREDCQSVIKAILSSIKDSNISPEQISYINAHGTSTPLNDRLETKAIRDALGAHAYKIPVSSLKSQIGHSTIASGAVETVACIEMLKNQKVAPTINFDERDPDCDLDYVPNSAREAQLKYTLSNSLGFGGQNACLVLKVWKQ
ncbi:beta-ketoacyl-[acyl-carrier-protein] synthase family protein [bacterium]|nr:beta-ketoacyl-[acyl-carrier-protein] synthase family protein [bacterium]